MCIILFQTDRQLRTLYNLCRLMTSRPSSPVCIMLSRDIVGLQNYCIKWKKICNMQCTIIKWSKLSFNQCLISCRLWDHVNADDAWLFMPSRWNLLERCCGITIGGNCSLLMALKFDRWFCIDFQSPLQHSQVCHLDTACCSWTWSALGNVL